MKSQTPPLQNRTNVRDYVKEIYKLRHMVKKSSCILKVGEELLHAMQDVHRRSSLLCTFVAPPSEMQSCDSTT